MDHWLPRENKSYMNFANLATFQTIELVHRAIFLKNSLSKIRHSVGKLSQFKSSVSALSARNAWHYDPDFESKTKRFGLSYENPS